MLDEFSVRKEKLARLIEVGVNPYPAETERTASCGEAASQFDAWSAEAREITLAGRLMTVRAHGALAFADLTDDTGKLQILLREDALDEKTFRTFCDLIDPGDFVQATGTLFVTKRGEKTLLVSSWTLLCKTLRPLPEKWHGLQDVEQRFRKRYLDLLMSTDVRDRMIARSKIVTAIRSFMDAQNFIEVETPTLQPVYGGGFARPFITHHNALEADFYLRISDEMYLKRLIVGGLERVYEITKVFRNEGVDHDHNPEFTMFEAQAAYHDYRWGMDIFEGIFEHAATAAFGTTEIVHEDATISVQRPWARYRLIDSVRELGGLDATMWTSLEQAKTELSARLSAKKRGELERMHSLGECLAFAFEELVEEKLIQPTIIYDYPIEVSPLAKKSSDPRYVERFEAFALGMEIGNNYSELNDPLDLERRFIEEKKKEAAGFDEAPSARTAGRGSPPSY